MKPLRLARHPAPECFMHSPWKYPSVLRRHAQTFRSHDNVMFQSDSQAVLLQIAVVRRRVGARRQSCMSIVGGSATSASFGENPGGPPFWIFCLNAKNTCVFPWPTVNICLENEGEVSPFRYLSFLPHISNRGPYGPYPMVVCAVDQEQI